MTLLAITGWGAVHPDGVGAARVPVGPPVYPPPAVTTFADEPVPPGDHHVLTGFDFGGRTGGGHCHRATAMAVLACGEALRTAAIGPGADVAEHTGVVLGTTLGALPPPVDPRREPPRDRPRSAGPSMVRAAAMSLAAAHVATRCGLRGVNSTIATGPLAIVSALRYAQTTIASGHCDVMLAGAVEEFSADRAWWVHHRHHGAIGTGEGAAVFAVRADDVRLLRDADVLGIASGFASRPADALAACIRRVLEPAGAEPGDVAAIVAGDPGTGAAGEYPTAVAVLGRRPPRIDVSRWWGECDAAAGALGLAAFLARVRHGALPSGALGLVTAMSPDGGAGAVLVRAWAHTRSTA
jgi:3-oxoacyl-[acyl-carrier-protein] synthase II